MIIDDVNIMSTWVWAHSSWFGVMATKYENITSIPPMYTRKISSAIQEDMNAAYDIASSRAISKMVIPILRGLEAINMVVVVINRSPVIDKSML